MKLKNITNNNKKKGGQQEKENFYNGQKLDIMEKGKPWYINPEKPTSLSSSFQSLSQIQRNEYDIDRKNKEEYNQREKEGLTFGGKTRRRRRRRKQKSKKRTRRKYRR